MTTIRALVFGEPAAVSSVCAPVRGQVAGASSRMRSLQSGSYSLSPRCAAAYLAAGVATTTTVGASPYALGQRD